MNRYILMLDSGEVIDRAVRMADLVETVKVFRADPHFDGRTFAVVDVKTNKRTAGADLDELFARLPR